VVQQQNAASKVTHKVNAAHVAQSSETVSAKPDGIAIEMDDGNSSDEEFEKY
jgi:hypothetical protein